MHIEIFDISVPSTLILKLKIRFQNALRVTELSAFVRNFILAKMSTSDLSAKARRQPRDKQTTCITSRVILADGDTSTLRLKNSHTQYLSSCLRLPPTRSDGPSGGARGGGLIYALPRSVSCDVPSSKRKRKGASVTHGISLYYCDSGDSNSMRKARHVPLLLEEQKLHYDSSSLSNATTTSATAPPDGVRQGREAGEEVLQCITWSPPAVLGGRLLSLQTNRGVFVYYIHIMRG